MLNLFVTSISKIPKENIFYKPQPLFICPSLICYLYYILCPKTLIVKKESSPPSNQSTKLNCADPSTRLVSASMVICVFLPMVLRNCKCTSQQLKLKNVAITMRMDIVDLGSAATFDTKRIQEPRRRKTTTNFTKYLMDMGS